MCLGIPGEVIELCEHEDLAALERVEEKTAKASLDFVTGRDGSFGSA